MHTFYFSAEFIKRFSDFLKSVKDQEVPSYSKSEYWKEHSKLINVSISDRTVTVSGCSGYYIPPVRKDRLLSIQHIKETLRPLIRRCKGLFRNEIKLLNYFDAFDAVMSNKPIAELSFGSQRVDFRKLSRKPEAVLSIKDMQARYFAKEKYHINAQVISSYYTWNILCAHTNLDAIRTVLEIGPGSGNFSALLYYQLRASVICVDLLETLCLSIPFIADTFPQAKILMPHEVATAGTDEYDFIFLTPQQILKIPNSSVDLAVNMYSFQEMTARQVKEYFLFIQRVSRRGGYFLTQNRVEKFLSGSDDLLPGEFVSRFCHYPWQNGNETVIYQICPLVRLVQLSNSFIRLEKIIK